MSEHRYSFTTLKVSFPLEYVLQVELNRPERLNTFNEDLWTDLRICFQKIKVDSDVRAVVLSATGRLFTAGLDLNSTTPDKLASEDDQARNSYRTRLYLLEVQDTFNAIEHCDKTVIAVIHGWCIGAGIDMITACDIRYCTQDAIFSVKEVDIGMAADVGTLQRLPKVVGNNSFVREVCLTARRFDASEALTFGLVNRVLQTKDEALAEGLKTAALIASKSPVASLGTKHLLNYSRDHTVAEGLQYTATWNAAMLNTKDMSVAISALMGKTKPTFSKL